jgi:hypothetical protein
MYQGTITPDNPVNNGEAEMDAEERASWFSAGEKNGEAAGFCYSRIKASLPRDPLGLHHDPLIGGLGSRHALSWSNAAWPNIVDLKIIYKEQPLASGTYAIDGKTPLSLGCVLLDYDSDSTVTLHADTDRNPYNANDLDFFVGPSTKLSATGKEFREHTLNLDPSSLPVATPLYLYASVTDGLRKRFFYASAQLLIVDNSMGKAVTVLQDLVRASSETNAGVVRDIDGDGVLGLAEALYFLQKEAMLR